MEDNLRLTAVRTPAGRQICKVDAKNRVVEILNKHIRTVIQFTDVGEVKIRYTEVK